MSLLLSRKRRLARAAVAAPAPALPADWRRLPAAELRALAEARCGRRAATKAAAIAALEQELNYG